uniref:Metalloendopeptidase n=1 Tax=Heligmosomoides polygyrus TaxID=6339 RepID=A0A183GFI3_HELPZ
LGRGCETIATVAHEIGHALGFFHTMGRHDRDEYVTVNLENIKNYPTMVPSDANYRRTIGSPFISFIDLSMMNELYECKERCKKEAPVTCERGGFPHPRDCQKCICPGGYGGTRCTERPEGCGNTLQASTEWQTLQDTLGEYYSTREDYTKCNYWIQVFSLTMLSSCCLLEFRSLFPKKNLRCRTYTSPSSQSPSDTVIEIRLAMFTRGVVADGCEWAGVEIKTNEDQTRTGYRFCSYYDRGTTLRSHSNLVPVITYNRHLRTTAILKYRYGRVVFRYISRFYLVPASSPSTIPLPVPPSSPSTISPTSAAKEPSDTEKEISCVDKPT